MMSNSSHYGTNVPPGLASLQPRPAAANHHPQHTTERSNQPSTATRTPLQPIQGPPANGATAAVDPSLPPAKRLKISDVPAPAAPPIPARNPQIHQIQKLVTKFVVETHASDAGVFAAHIRFMTAKNETASFENLVYSFELSRSNPKSILGHLHAIIMGLDRVLALIRGEAKTTDAMTIDPAAAVAVHTSSDNILAFIQHLKNGNQLQGHHAMYRQFPQYCEALRSLFQQVPNCIIQINSSSEAQQVAHRTPTTNIQTAPPLNLPKSPPVSAQKAPPIHPQVGNAPKKPPSNHLRRFVTASEEHWGNFMKMWKKQDCFSFSLVYESKVPPRPQPELPPLQTNNPHAKHSKSLTLPSDLFVSIPGFHYISAFVVCTGERVWVAKFDSPNVSDEVIWSGIREVMTSSQSLKVAWNMKPLLKLLLAKGIQPDSGLRDPYILNWLRDPDANGGDFTMETCWNSLNELQLNRTWDDLMLQYDQNVDPSSKNPERAIKLNEAIKHAAASYRLFRELEKACGFTPETAASSLYYPELQRIFEGLEMSILPIIAEMEFCGVGFDANMFADMKDRMQKKVAYLEKRAKALFGQEVDLNSPYAVGQALFGGSRPLIPYPIDIKPGQHFSSKKMILQMVSDHILPCVILEHRKLMHTINTYLDPLPRYAHSSKAPVSRKCSPSIVEMNRIYALCLQTNVPTGRLACDSPNLQSIPNAFDYTPLPESMLNHSGSEDVGSPNGKSFYRTHASASEDSPLPALKGQKPIRVSIRDSFVATPGFAIVSCDYRHLELRIMAHFSQDEVLLPLFQDPENDIFQMMAAAWFKKDTQLVNSSERAKAKAVCYGLLYGKGTKALATDLECTYNQAEMFIKNFQSTFKGIESFISATHKSVAEKGFVSTLLGRRRFLDTTGNNSEKAASRRKAVNTVCQGTAADIVKSAMVRIWRELFLPIKDQYPRMLINMHDELLFEVPEESVFAMASKIQDIMENTVKLNGVPLPVKVRAGPSWGSLVPIEEYLKPTVLNFGQQ